MSSLSIFRVTVDWIQMIFYANPSGHCHPSARNEPVIVLKTWCAPGDLLFVSATESRFR